MHATREMDHRIDALKPELPFGFGRQCRTAPPLNTGIIDGSARHGDKVVVDGFAGEQRARDETTCPGDQHAFGHRGPDARLLDALRQATLAHSMRFDTPTADRALRP